MELKFSIPVLAKGIQSLQIELYEILGSGRSKFKILLNYALGRKTKGRKRVSYSGFDGAFSSASLWKGSNSTAQQDPRPPSSQGSCLKTHDFLQPLERVETKASAKEEATEEISSVVQKPPSLAAPASVEHLLPGGIGTYSISHISYFNNNQRIPKPETSLFTVHQATSADRNDDNSNCSSYTSSGFTLWEESAIKRERQERRIM
ncbi:hypothetical protein SESBI_33994 [Sesbania bispinosa]|nr:hypothetical protein SESBI_33994 [Sesbania bispinosa]